MHSDIHERARRLMDAALVAGIPPDDQRWLDDHTAGCAECADGARETARMLGGLNALSFDPDPAMARRVRQAVAVQARGNRWRTAAWIAAAVVMLAGAPVYRGVRERQREAAIEQQDALLMQNVGARISQAVPEALEPLRVPAEGTK